MAAAASCSIAWSQPGWPPGSFGFPVAETPQTFHGLKPIYVHQGTKQLNRVKTDRKRMQHSRRADGWCTGGVRAWPFGSATVLGTIVVTMLTTISNVHHACMAICCMIVPINVVTSLLSASSAPYWRRQTEQVRHCTYAALDPRSNANVVGRSFFTHRHATVWVLLRGFACTGAASGAPPGAREPRAVP